MISLSRLLCNSIGPGDEMRYGHVERPIVVWNSTRRCNLNCMHCYARAQNLDYKGELSTVEARDFIQDLSEFGVPALLLSGGEPLIREDMLDLAAWAMKLGIRTVVSTNGTLISPALAERMAGMGFAEIGISLDGTRAVNDHFRGKDGAFDGALGAIRSLINFGQRVSLRLTMTRHNFREIPAIFDLVESEGIQRVCFYHLTYAGRASKLRDEDLSPDETRAAVDLIIDRTIDLHRRGLEKEVLTVDNHADAVHVYLKISEEDPARANSIFELLKRNGGNNAGIKIAAVDNTGAVHPDQFWWHYTLGNVREKKFSEIWTSDTDPLLNALRDRKPLLKGRCAQCRWLELCNGNLRVRAEATYGDVWAEDPACYLTDREIGLAT